jgi:hypothetical protein
MTTIVIAGFMPATHVFRADREVVNGRDERGPRRTGTVNSVAMIW